MSTWARRTSRKSSNLFFPGNLSFNRQFSRGQSRILNRSSRRPEHGGRREDVRFLCELCAALLCALCVKAFFLESKIARRQIGFRDGRLAD